MKRAPLLVLLVLVLGAAWWWSNASSASESLLDELGTEAERLHALQDHARSERAYAEAAAQAERDGNWMQHFAFRAQRGVCLKMLGRNQEARAELLPALEWARENDNLKIEGLALGNLAKLATYDGDLDTALARMDELVEVAAAGQDLRTVVLSLEQVANVYLLRGEPREALPRLQRALELNAQLEEVDDRRDALQRQAAWALAQLGDDEGAFSLWESTPRAPAGDAHQAQHLSDLGLHDAAAQSALRAALGFDESGAPLDGQRDDALALQVDQLLRAGLLDVAAERLSELLQPGGNALAQAPFRVLEGRLAWFRGDLPRAESLFRQARETLLDEDPDAHAGAAQSATWLQALALDELGQNDAARDLAAQLPDNLASTLLRGWFLRDLDDPERLVTTELTRLSLGRDAESRAALAADRSLQHLRELSPRELPSMAWLSLHLHLSDGDRLLLRERRDLRESFVARGLSLAVKWHMRELAERVLGRWPDARRLEAHEAGLDRWLSGGLPEDEAVAAVFTGPTLSYLAVFTKEWPGTCFGLPAGPDLVKRSSALSQALRTGSIDDVAGEGHRLYRLLFGTRAREDISEKRLLSFLLPPELAGVPPALLVSSEPQPGRMPAWLVRERDLRLLAFPPAAPRIVPDAYVLRAGDAAVDPDASKLLLTGLLNQFGGGILNPGDFFEREAGSPRFLRGDALTASALRASGDALRWELSASGSGTGRLGALLLAPDPSSERVDEQRGLLPWPRLAEMSLPTQLLLDRTRFDPLDGGALLAATAATLGGAQSVLLTRWPLSTPLREGFLGPDPGLLMVPTFYSRALRGYLSLAEEANAPEVVQHPRAWAAWMLFGGEQLIDAR
ncbi:MAG: hypothetical protein DHS20C15_10320 [Planctomycetota bacterium]|nr:MAG: hypothetical protein DHS20C15_10320 [Planctomycetota bacterium]